MAHRTHSSWRKTGRKTAAGPTTPLAQQAEAQRRLADGIHRPEPSTAPPSRENTWVDERLAAQQQREEDEKQARRDRLAARGGGAPDQTEGPDSE